MKKLFLIAFWLLSLFSFGFAENFTIQKYEVEGNILEDGTIEVSEHIATYFTRESHGIKRFIPYRYTVQGTPFRIFTNDEKVKNDPYEKSIEYNNLVLKIGDPDELITWPKKYDIAYSTYGLIRNFSGMGYAELYWNPVGDQWETTIDSVKITLNLPKSLHLTRDDVLVLAWKGNIEDAQYFKGNVDIKNSKITITYNKVLDFREGITLSIKFPNDYFQFDHQKQQAVLVLWEQEYYETPDLNVISLRMYIGWGVLLVVYTFLMIRRICKRRKKPDLITVQYSAPKGVSASEIGVLIDDVIDPRDISCIFYEWALNKIIKIEQTSEGGIFSSEEFTITKLKNLEWASTYQKKFFDKLFAKKGTVVLSKTDHALQEAFYQCYKALAKSVKEKGRYETDDINEFRTFRVMRITLCLCSAFWIFLYYYLMVDWINNTLMLPVHEGWSDVSCFSVLYMIAWIWTSWIREEVKTEKSKELYTLCLGYQEFIQQCDEAQLRTFLAEDPLFVDKTLPYAVAFGLESAFIKKVSPLLQEQVNTEELNGYRNLVNSASMLRDFCHGVANYTLSHSTTYSTSSGFSSGSSFGGGFSWGGWGWWGGGSSW